MLLPGGYMRLFFNTRFIHHMFAVWRNKSNGCCIISHVLWISHMGALTCSHISPSVTSIFSKIACDCWLLYILIAAVHFRWHIVLGTQRVVTLCIATTFTSGLQQSLFCAYRYSGRAICHPMFHKLCMFSIIIYQTVPDQDKAIRMIQFTCIIVHYFHLISKPVGPNLKVVFSE